MVVKIISYGQLLCNMLEHNADLPLLFYNDPAVRGFLTSFHPPLAETHSDFVCAMSNVRASL